MPLTDQSFGEYRPIGDYGLIGNRHTAALVNSSGSIDWLCWPRFDSPSIFASILDPEKGGNWSIQPTSRFRSYHRYLKDTNILETYFACPQGKIAILDFMDMSWAEQEMEVALRESSSGSSGAWRGTWRPSAYADPGRTMPAIDAWWS